MAAHQDETSTGTASAAEQAGPKFVDGWAAILQPPGWTPAKAERLRDIITASE